MEIRRLRLSGFKSFVDATDLRIEPGLTGIVGPNGCGKSNLLEAIRWVMGEGSARSLRGSGMDDVIFAGTATRPRRDFAEVALHAGLAPGEATAAIPVGADGELEIVRRIERGTGSAYRANGRDVRARDVALLFADAATGAHSPALVSQGRIAAVIAARPQERRAMLEEAAGIAGLHVRRKDAEQKLRAAEANLARLEEILADMDGRANSLRRQARAAERYTRLTEAIRTAEARALYARWREADHAAQAAQAEAATREAAVRAAMEAQTAAAVHAQAAVDRLAAARAAAQTAHDAALAAGHRLDALKHQLAEATRRLADLDAQARRLGEDRAREDALAHDATEAIARLGEEAAALKRRIAEAERQAPARALRLAEAQEAARTVELEQARALARQAEEQAGLKVAQAALAAAETRLERADRTRARLEAEQAALPLAAPLEDRREAADRAATQARTRQGAAEAALAGAEAERDRAARRREDAEAARAAARATLAALESEAQALRRALAGAAGNPAGNASADKTPAASARLIDRVRVAPGWEQALAATLGDDLEAGLDAGAARHWAGAPPSPHDPALPPGTMALNAHVTAPPALARRLAQILAMDSDTGIPLAAGQVLVTRDGTLRRWDGLQARGGADAAGADAAQRLIRANRLEALDAQIPTARREADAAQAEAQAAGAEAEAAGAAIAAQGAALAAARREEADAARRRDDAVAQLARLADRHADARTRLAEAQADREAAATDVAAARAALAALPDGIETRAHVARLSAGRETAQARLDTARADAALADRALQADHGRLADIDAEGRRWRSRSGEAGKRLADMARREQAMAAERAALADQPDRLARQVAEQAAETGLLDDRARTAHTAEGAAETALRTAEATQAQAGETLSLAREARAGASARAEAAVARRTETNRLCGERFECPPPLLPERLAFAAAQVETAEREQEGLERLTAERERIGPVNLIATRELDELEEAQRTSRRESAEIAQAIHRLRGSVGTLNREGRVRLLAAFEAVNGHFQRLFATLFDGGQARLELVDSDDPLEAGLEILAQPPGKKLAALTLLSGGEQALTAVALIFGLFLTNPAPICVLDEVDAPLDDANVERLCDLLDRMTRDTRTRYLIVSHNPVTMSRMHRLYGVTMVEKGISRLVSVDLGGAERLLATP